MTLKKVLDQAADDLDDVETALLALTSQLEADSKPRIKYKLPGTVRCTELVHMGRRQGEPCREPALYPYGLCAQHFLTIFGHRFRYSWHSNELPYCVHCGQKFPFPKQVMRENCPDNPSVAHRKRLLAAFGCRVKGA